MNKYDQLDFLTLNDWDAEADKASFCSFIVFLCDYALGELWPWTWDVWESVIWYLSNGCWRHEWPTHAWWYLNWIEWPLMEFKSESNLIKKLITSHTVYFNNIDFWLGQNIMTLHKCSFCDHLMLNTDQTMLLFDDQTIYTIIKCLNAQQDLCILEVYTSSLQ